MKKPFALVGITLAAVLCVAQTPLITLSDSTNSLILTFRDFSITNPNGPITRFELGNKTGNVHAISKKQGLDLTARHVVVNAMHMFSKDANTIRDAVATGGVTVIKTGQTGRSEMVGSTAKYDAKTTSATISVSGPVTLKNFVGSRQSFVATGSSLTANLGKVGAREPIQTAKLSGPVHIRLVKEGVAGAQASTLNITSQRMVLDQAVHPAQIVLDGGVRATGLVSGFTTNAYFNHLVLTLTDKGEVARITGGSE